MVVRVCAYRVAGMLSTKIKTHALKRSRKCAALAAELLESLSMPDDDDGLHGGAGGGGGDENIELLSLREAHAALLEEAAFHKRQAEMYARENRRLAEMAKGVKKTKKQLLQQIADLEATIARDRRERAAMEVALSEAYTQTLKDIIQKQDAQTPYAGNGNGNGNGNGGSGSGGHHSGGGGKKHGWFR